MSEELAQDDADAEDYDMEALERRHRDDDDNATLVGGPRGSERLAEDSVVFEIGDEDDDDLNTPKTGKKSPRLSGEQEGLMNGRH